MIRTVLLLILVFNLSLLAKERLYSIQLVTSDNMEALVKIYESLPQKIKNRSIIYKTDSGRLTIRYLLSKRATPLRKIAKNLKIEDLRGGFWVVNTDPQKAKKAFFNLLERVKNGSDRQSYLELKNTLSQIFGKEPPQKKELFSKRPQTKPKHRPKEEPVEQSKEESVETKKTKKPTKLTKKRKKPFFFPEPWMLLNIALHDYDKERMRRVLSKYIKTLPHRDEVQALFELQRYDDSKSYAFDYMSRYIYDYHLYKQFLDIIHTDASRLDLRLTHINRGTLSYLQNEAQITKEWSQKRYFTFATKKSLFQDYDSQILKDLPSSQQEFGFGYKELLNRGFYELYAGYKDHINRYWSFQALYFNRCTDKIDSYVKIALNENTQESSHTIVAARADSVELFTTYKMDNKRYFETALGYKSIEDQEGKALGNAKEFLIRYIFKTRTAYPDITYKTYLKRAIFSKNYPTELIKRISVEDNPQFLPDSYYEGGVGILFGYDHKYRYTRRWRPFVDLGLYYNSVTYGGFSANIGIGGPLFRKDNISFSVGYSNAVDGINQEYIESMIYYFYFF